MLFLLSLRNIWNSSFAWKCGGFLCGYDQQAIMVPPPAWADKKMDDVFWLFITDGCLIIGVSHPNLLNTFSKMLCHGSLRPWGQPVGHSFSSVNLVISPEQLFDPWAQIQSVLNIHKASGCISGKHTVNTWQAIKIWTCGLFKHRYDSWVTNPGLSLVKNQLNSQNLTGKIRYEITQDFTNVAEKASFVTTIIHFEGTCLILLEVSDCI